MGLEDQPGEGWEIRTGAAQKGLCLRRLIYPISQKKSTVFSKNFLKFLKFLLGLLHYFNQDVNKAAAGTANIPLPKDRVSSPV